PLPWVGFKTILGIACRLDLKHPPTPVGGISEFSYSVGSVGRTARNASLTHPLPPRWYRLHCSALTGFVSMSCLYVSNPRRGKSQVRYAKLFSDQAGVTSFRCRTSRAGPSLQKAAGCGQRLAITRSDPASYQAACDATVRKLQPRKELAGADQQYSYFQ